MVKDVPEFPRIPFSGNQPIVNLSDADGPGYLNSMVALSFAVDGTLIYLDICCPLKTAQVIKGLRSPSHGETAGKGSGAAFPVGAGGDPELFYSVQFLEGTVSCQVELPDVEFCFQRSQAPDKVTTLLWLNAVDGTVLSTG